MQHIIRGAFALQRPRLLLLAAAILALPLLRPPVVQGDLVPITGLSGFNVNVVDTGSPARTGPGGGTLDTFNFYYPVGYSGTFYPGSPSAGQPAPSPAGTGLPANPAIPLTMSGTGAGDSSVQFQLQPYTGNNVLQLPNTSLAADTGTLTLTTPTAYTKLAIIGQSNGGDTQFTITLHCSDGHPDLAVAGPLGINNLHDWMDSQTIHQALIVGSAFNGFGYSGTPGSTPALFEDQDQLGGGTDTGGIDLAAFGVSTDPISSITFQNTTAIGGFPTRHIINIFAVSGQPTFAEVPEPSSIVLLGVTALGAAAGAWRKRRFRGNG